MNDIRVAYQGMRLTMSLRKFTILCNKLTDRRVPWEVADYIDGGSEGWPCGDEQQQEWLDGATVRELSEWID